MAKVEQATLGGGCFWCLEAVYQELEGVESVKSGYSGGHVAEPSYREVCTGTTGHAEVVRVTFDPEVVSYRDLLEVFYTIHDPTTRDRQGADVGPQYRSAIFWHSEEQREMALTLIEELTSNGALGAPIVTEVAELDTFWPAEADHDDYYRNNTFQPYCQLVIEPKLQKFRDKHAALRRG